MEPTTLALLVAVVIGVAVAAATGRKSDRPTHDPVKSIRAAWYSASDGYGGYFTYPAGVPLLHRYDPDPVAMITARGPVLCVNRSHNGMRLRELLAGGRLANGLPEVLGETGVTIPPFAEQLAHDRCEIAVIGAGMVDWVFDPITRPEYEGLLAQAVDQARAQGVQPVFLGFSRFALSDVITPERQARLEMGNRVLQDVAAALQVPYIDRSGVDPIMAEDGLHLIAECHQRAAIEIAPQLAAIAARMPA